MSFKKYKILGIFANHTSNILKYNVSLNNLSFIRENLDEIIIIDSKDEEFAIKLKNDLAIDNKIIHHVLVENSLIYFDFGKWIDALKLINTKLYDYIFFTNDSIVITNNLKPYFDNLNENIRGVNIYGYNDSNELKYHYQSFLFMINTKIIDKFIYLFESKKHLITNLQTLIDNIELNLVDIDKNRKCFFPIVEKYNISSNLCYKNEELYKHLLLQKNYGIFKLKRITEIQNNFKATIYGKKINIFNYKFYRSKYKDISQLNDKEAINHFLENGQFEGRIPDDSVKNFLLPNYYRKIFEECGILCLFDIPDDFDIYFYKTLNEDLREMANFDILNHYINNGIYEGRPYLNDDSGPYKNYLNFYKILFNRFQYIENSNIDSLKDDFNINFYMKVNKNKINSNVGHLGILKNYYDNENEHNLSFNNKINNNLDIDLYKKIYNELENSDDEKILEHYIKNNNNFIYKLPNSFNSAIYKSLYKDIRNLDDINLKKHYIEIGRNEKRLFNLDDESINKILSKKDKTNKLPKDFDSDIYKLLNPDLINFSNDFLENHFLITYNINQKRLYKIPSDYDQNIYKNNNPDLAHLNGSQLFEHFINFGIHEKRIYSIPKDFNINDYKKLNDDLKHLSQDELLNHFIHHGIREKRKYKIKK